MSSDPTSDPTPGGGGLGGFLRQRREQADISLRQFSERVGISNAYLSQIERGLRTPSEEVLGRVAGALRISADTLARFSTHEGEEPQADPSAVVEAIRADDLLQPRQRQALLETYEAFVEVNRARRGTSRRPAAIVEVPSTAAETGAAATAEPLDPPEWSGTPAP